MHTLFRDQSGLGRRTAGEVWLRLQVLPSLLPTPPPTSWGWEVEGERRWLCGEVPADAADSCLRHTTPPLLSTNLSPFGRGWDALSPGRVHLLGGRGKVKGSLMCLRHSGKPQSLDGSQLLSSSLAPSPSPKPSSAAWGNSHRRHLLFLGTTRNSPLSGPWHSWGADCQWSGALCPQPGFLIRCLPGFSDHPF